MQKTLAQQIPQHAAGLPKDTPLPFMRCLFSALLLWSVSQSSLAHGPTPHTLSNELTPEQWIDHGRRVHGGFGVLIGVGIRIGQDALDQLKAKPRQVDVTYFDSPVAPCPCIADGLIVALSASPGQRSFRIAEQPAGQAWYGEVLIRHKQSGEEIRYCIRPEGMKALDAAQRQTDTRVRYDAVMALPLSDLAVRSANPLRCE